MAASIEESPAPAAAAANTTPTEVTESVKEVVTAPPPVVESEAVKGQEETKADNGTVAAESSPNLEPQGSSFKEESYFVADLKESEKKALQELKTRVEEAIKNNEFKEPPPKEPETKEAEAKEATEAKEPEAKEAEVAEASKETETKEEKAKEAQTKGEEDTQIPEAKEEVKGTVEEVKILETTTETDIKIGEVEIKKEEIVVAVAEQVEVPAHGDVPKHEETVIVSENATESVTVVSVPSTETAAPSAESAAEVPVEVTVTKETVEVDLQPVEEIYLWGVPLLPSVGDERTDVILLKFLRARDFKVSEAFTMLKNTILWRKRFGADGVLEEEFGNELDGVAYMHGYDKEGHPVCYNVYGVFQDKELYQKTFGDAEKCDRFLRWRIRLLEKGIQQLSFKPGGINSMVQITDLKNSPGPGKKGLRQATKKALDILQDNYPEFVARKIFVNVPWWYAAMSAMISPFLTQRTKSKFVVARPARLTETLFKYISPQFVPVQYGGLSRENDTEFSASNGAVSELFIKPGVKQIVEIPATEVGTSLVWDIAVVSWEVIYSEEFVPNAEGGYTVIIQKAKKMAAEEEPVRNSFKISEPGKVILTIENISSKKKHVVYRTKVKSD
uniref:CRAL-TRIO domain-containing protein n=1 Tax=Araucaria cunninghamii TaxID=56994 RepID=A0A0D6R5X4_ARACU